MKVIQVNKEHTPLPVSAPANGTSEDVSAYGPDSLVVQLTITAASTPNTASAQLQGSVDGTNWFNEGSPVSITTNAVLKLAAIPVYYKHYRVAYAIASGSFTATERFFVYGSTF